MEPDNFTFVEVKPDPDDENKHEFVTKNDDLILNLKEERISNDYSDSSDQNYVHAKDEFAIPNDPISTSTEENYSDSDSSSDDTYTPLNGSNTSHSSLALGVPVNEFCSKNQQSQTVIQKVFLLESYNLTTTPRSGRPGRKPSGRTPEEKRELQRLRRKEMRHAMSEEKRALQRIKIRERVRKSRLMQSEEEKAYQKMMDRERKRKLRGCQTEEEREIERMKNRERMRRTRLLQTAEERAWENLKARERKRRMRASLRQEQLQPCNVAGLLNGALFCEPSQLLEIEYTEGTAELCHNCNNI